MAEWSFLEDVLGIENLLFLADDFVWLFWVVDDELTVCGIQTTHTRKLLERAEFQC